MRPDAGQERAAGSLEELRQKILSHTVQVEEYQVALAAWEDQVASLREQQRLAEARERERLAKLPFYQQPWFTQPRWLLWLRDLQAAPPVADPGSGSGASCASGGCSGGEGSCAARAAPEEALAGLSEAELQHPFWRTGLGSRARLRAGELPSAVPASGSAARPASAEREGQGEEAQGKLPDGAPPRPERPPQPAGLFLHGSVGAGKTMLMDWFAEAMAEDVRPGSEAVPPAVRCSVRRVHYNAFMIECHARLHRHTEARRELERAAGREGRGEARGGSWSVMGELVRMLTRETTSAEPSSSLSEALASISSSIINDIPEVHRAAPEHAPGAAPAAAAAGAVPGAAAVPGALAASPAQQERVEERVERVEERVEARVEERVGRAATRAATCGVLCFDEVQVRSALHACVYAYTRCRCALPTAPCMCMCTLHAQGRRGDGREWR